MDHSVLSLENLIDILSQNHIFILGILLISAYFIVFKRDKISEAPAILTTFAIFGTFYGILLGLINFDASDVQKSVPDLIAGVKTAFAVSALGILCALSFKIYSLIKLNSDNGKHIGATADDINDNLKKIHDALTSDENKGAYSQLKLLRSDFSDFLREASENNSKALVQALEEVMRDFNTKINEQFGDNFKQLNEAVEKILVWQEAYKDQVSEMISQNNTASNNLEVASSNFLKIVDATSNFSKAAEDSEKVIQSLVQQNDNLNVSLEKISSYIEQADKGFPQIEEHLKHVINQMKDASQDTSDALKMHLTKTSKEISQSLQNEMQKSQKDLISFREDLQKVMFDALTKSNGEVNTQITNLIEKTQQQIVNLDKALSDELSKSLESFGKQMASLSNKFANDYTPLTDRLREVVQISQKINERA